jgi:hypothetical protein
MMPKDNDEFRLTRSLSLVLQKALKTRQNKSCVSFNECSMCHTIVDFTRAEFTFAYLFDQLNILW